MKNITWKILAIIFGLCFYVFFIYSVIYVNHQEKNHQENQMNECYYNICEDYPGAWINEDICYCYDYDVLGNSVISKEVWMGGIDEK